MSSTKKAGKNNIQNGGITAESVLARLVELEKAVSLNFKLGFVPGYTIPKTIDISSFLEQWEKKPAGLLQKLYPPIADNVRVYLLQDYELSTDCFGYWPQGQAWKGLYLGGCEQSVEARRAITIPFCVMNQFDFFTPQGSALSGDTFVKDIKDRLSAMATCGSAVVDFTGDELCLNYSAGLDLLFLISLGFVNVTLIQLPVNEVAGSMKFNDDEKIQNVFGPWNSITLRQRRREYYEVLRCVTNCVQPVLEEYETVEGKTGFGNALINMRPTFSQYHNDGIGLTVLERRDIYRKLVGKQFTTDVGTVLRIAMGMFILCEMASTEFMDTNMPEWRILRGEFESLVIQSKQVYSRLLDVSEYDDSYYHSLAMVEIINYTSVAVSERRHLAL